MTVVLSLSVNVTGFVQKLLQYISDADLCAGTPLVDIFMRVREVAS